MSILKLRMMLLLTCVTFFFALSALAQEVNNIRVFKQGGDQVDWCKSSGTIAYAMRGPDHCYGIHICGPNGENDVWLTDNNPHVPPGQKGSPSWHPSGKYILFAAEKPEHTRMHFESTPGLGSFSDLWLITADGAHGWQLTNTPYNKNSGVIIPKFSHDGKRVVWAERVEAPRILNPKQFCGFWDIKVADFVEGPQGPFLTNVKIFRPGGNKAFNESYGFSPDDRKIIFCSDYNQQSFWTCQIFTCDADTGGNITQLTEKSYNEHAVYSYDGQHIVWMSATDEKRGTDWWMMNADGSNKKQITFFNKRGHPEYRNSRMTCGLGCFSPDGKSFLGGIQDSIIKQTGSSYMLTLP